MDSNSEKNELLQNQNPKIKSIVDSINYYEKLLALDKPADFFLLLWTSFIGLWIATYQQPQFLQILFIIAVVMLSRCFLLSITFVFQNIISNKNLLPANKTPILIPTLLSLLLFVLVFLIFFEFSQALANYLVLAVLGIFIVCMYVYKSSIASIGSPSKNIFVQILIYLLLAIIYASGSLISFALIVGKLTQFIWHIFIMQIFITFAWVVFADTVFAKIPNIPNLLNSQINILVSMVCVTLYIISMFNFYLNRSANPNLLMLLIIVAVIFFDSLFRLYRYKNTTEQHVSIKKGYAFLQNITFYPLAFWLVLINWRDIFS